MLNRPSRSLRRIVGSTSAIALATALVAPAQAQSINAPAPTVVSGSATFNSAGTVDTVTINSNTAVLDFVPNDTGVGGGAINFQNANTTLRFDRVGQDFTVLNRIVPADPTRAVQFNGTVESRIVSTITNPGGNVWFYSPGGIILGTGAVFNVGSLLLSTADPTGGTGTITSTNVFNLSSTADSGAAVTIQPGAQIKALNEGSYVALVAPVVNQNGDVLVNGNAAYVAAEQATLTFSGGLFDVQVAVGSDGGGAPLVHNGSTAGPSSTGAADKHGIYMVAVPKNSAITMAIAPTGQLGFDVAASATIENGAIYLQAGGNVTIDPTKTIVNRIQALPNSVQPASIELRDGTITSTIAAQATTDVSVIANTVAGLTLAQDAYFFGQQNATIVATAEASFTASQSVILNAFGGGLGSKAQVDALGESKMSFAELRVHADPLSGRVVSGAFDTAQAGIAALRSTGGSITVAGDVKISAVGTSPTAVSTFGGKADITANKSAVLGSISVGNNAFVDVSAVSQNATNVAIAGTGNISAFGNSSIKATNLLSISANASGTNGASAQAGSALLSTGTDGGAIETVTASLNADAVGGSAITGTAGSAVGGIAQIDIAPIATTGTGTIKVASATVSALATGGTGSSSAGVTGGNATGGQARLIANKGGAYSSTGATNFTAVARGGAGVAGGAGGSATQGRIDLSAFEGGGISFATAKLDADTFGGAGGAGPTVTIAGGKGGDALIGPGAFVFAGGGGTITGGKTEVLAIARAGAGGNGFSGTGLAGAGGNTAAGSAVISTDTGGMITLGETSIFTGVGGGATGTGQAAGPLAGGDAFGGISTLNAKAGAIDLVSLVMATVAGGGNGVAVGSSGGDATAGTLFVGASAGGTLKVGSARFELDSNAIGGSATAGGNGTVSGGDAIAGKVDINIGVGSSLQTTANFVEARATGTGGAVVGTGGQGDGGLGQAGRTTMEISGVASFPGNILLNARGTGGSAVAGGAGGVGKGGAAQIGSFGANASTSLTIGGNVDFDIGAEGGFSPAGAGGAAFGGITIDPVNGPFNGVGLFVNGGTFSIGGGIFADAEVFGGDGATGGAATGGSVRMSVSPNASLTAQGFGARANVFGGDANASVGAVGGAASGGSIDVFAQGTLSFSGAVSLEVAAFGGDVTFVGSGTAGAATGGKSFFTASGGDILVGGNLTGDASATGGSNDGTGDGGAAAGGRMRLSTFAFGTPAGSGTSTLTIKGFADLRAEGSGGQALSGAGGAGSGGVFVPNVSSNGVEVHVLGGAITFEGSVDASALGRGGSGTAQGGVGTGGRVSLISFGGDLNLRQSLFGDSRGLAGSANAGIGGNAQGGVAQFQAIAGTNVNVPAGTPSTVSAAAVQLNVSATGGFGANGGGAGQAGTASLFVDAAQHSLNSTGLVSLTAQGFGGNQTGSGAGPGGLGKGGTALVQTNGGLINIAGLNANANGNGGSTGAVAETAGDGLGGTIFVGASVGGTLKVGTEQFILNAQGFGGFASSSTIASPSQGGSGFGGTADTGALTGGTVDVGVAFATIFANGGGGSISGSGNGDGGDGIGGTARATTNGGTVIFRGGVDIVADASGGSATNGAGGAGTGGEARIGTFNGNTASNVQVIGDLRLDASGFGGFSSSGLGGAGNGGTPADINKGPFNKGVYMVATGGTITIGGFADLDANGSGGDGGAGGGAGTGGLVDVFGFGAAISVGQPLSIDSSGLGGDAFNGTGSAGGRGTGGGVILAATSGGSDSVVTTPPGTPSSLTLKDVFVDVSGQGGTGGSGAVGSFGGQGGDGEGGFASARAEAGSGTLTTGAFFLFAQGVGGDGGTGGNAPLIGGSGGNGGKGGAGLGGFSNAIGTTSGPDTTINTGSATFGDMTIFASAIGGAGGDGLEGGVGGDGGAATASSLNILSRGALVTAGTVSIDISAFGGAGGAGSTAGRGGDAVAGNAGILATPRFNIVTMLQDRPERGAFKAADFSATAIALGGTGSSAGAATAGRVGIEVTKSEVTLGSGALSAFTVSGGELPPATPSFLKVDSGTLDVAGNLSFSVVGDFDFTVVNGGLLRTGSLSLDVTRDLISSAALTATPGTVAVTNGIFGDFGGKFITTSNFDLAGPFLVSAVGDIQVGNVTAGGDIDLDSEGSITGGNLTAGGLIEAIADGFVTLGNLEAGTDPNASFANVVLEGSAGVKAGNIRGVSVDIDDGIVTDSIVGITTGDIAAEGISISSTKNVTLGTVTQGDIYPTSDFDTFGDVFLAAEGTLTTLAIDAIASVDLFGGQSIVSGAISSGASIFIGSDGSVSTGNITAGLSNDLFDGGDVEVFAFGSAAVANVKAARLNFQIGDPANPAAGFLRAGDLSAETLTLDVAGTITAGNISTGDIYSGIDTAADNYLIGIGALGDIKLGSVDAFTSVGVGSLTGKVETGAIRANDSVMLLAKTDIVTGGIVGGGDPTDSVFLSNISILQSNPDFTVLQDFDELGGLFDIDVLATAAPVPTGGPINIGGNVSTVNFAAATSQTFQSGAITAANRLFLNVAGTIGSGALSTSGGLFLTSDKSINVGNLVAASVDLTSKQDVTFGAVSSSGTVIVTAGGLATVNGQVVGNSILVTSNDISIAAGGGLNGGFSVALVSTAGQTRFGGAAGGSGYVLDGVEAQGVRANSVEFRSTGPTTLGSVFLQGSGAGSAANLVGSGGRLQVTANGSLLVNGLVAIGNANAGSSGDRLSITGTAGVEIDTDAGGGIAVVGSDFGILSGTLQLSGPTIRVATAALLDQLGSQTAAQRAQALVVPPSGAPRPQGYLQAGRIEFRANELLIQNSNTAAQFGGFSAGSGGAVLRGFSGNQADAIIFGRIADGSGAFKINQEAVPLLLLTDGEGAPSTVTAASLFNNCPFTGACGTPPPPPPPPPPPEVTPVQEVIAPVPVNVLAIVEDVLPGNSEPETVAALPTINLVTTIDTGQLRTEPLITDPVTGGGNPSLWEGAAEPAEDDERRPSRDPGDEQ